MKSNTILIVILFFVITSNAQNYTISGIIKDSISSENLVNVTIIEKSNQKYITCNEFGYYCLTIPKGKNIINFVVTGYKNKYIKINLQKDTIINVELVEQNIKLNKIVISATKTKTNIYNLPMAKVNNMPIIAGETDILKSLLSSTGVSTGNEGSASLNVRGGSPDQNLFLLDGIPVYNVNHIFGFFSVFNTDAIKSVKLLKGGIPAQYNGKTSSVVDIYMKEGNLKKYNINFSLGLISSKFLLEGPIKKNKSSFIITARRTFIDLLFKPFSKKIADNTNTGFYFYDINLKNNFVLSEKSRLFISIYTGQDNGYIKFSERQNVNKSVEIFNDLISWGNFTGAIRLLKIISQKVSMNNSIFYTKYNYNAEKYSFFQKEENNVILKKEMTYKQGSKIQEIGLKNKFDIYINSYNSLTCGLSVSKKIFNPSFISEYYNDDYSELNINNSLSSQKINAFEFSIYAENNIKINRFNINLGTNYNSFLVNFKYYNYIEPIISVNYDLTKQICVQLSYSKMHQYLHLLTNSSAGMPHSRQVKT